MGSLKDKARYAKSGRSAQKDSHKEHERRNVDIVASNWGDHALYRDAGESASLLGIGAHGGRIESVRVAW